MKATYHYDAAGTLVPREFTVLKKHPNGKVDLGPEGGEAVVTNCEVSTEPENGRCVLAIEKKSDEKPAADKKADAKK